MLGGDGELLMDGGLGIVRAYVQGNTELVCIGGQKNILTQSILAKPPIKRLEDLRGKKVGVTRIGSTTHYFATEAFRKIGMEAGKDYSIIQTGGARDARCTLNRRDRGRNSRATLGCSSHRPRFSVRCLWT
jgi:ABC-type nitrate/sulfonate/bicarbonate transport system substrate-binding protein